MRIGILITSFVLGFLHISLCAAKDFVVVIDAGHGGHDAGAVGTFSKEKDINLAIALRVGNLIKNNVGGVNVVYTRDKDFFVPLMDRARIANRASADLFISIHTNAVADRARSPQGVETYSLGVARSEANLNVAKRENAAILMEDNYKERYAGFNPNSSESYIIFETTQNKYMEQSVGFASFVQSQMKSYCKRIDKGVKQAGFLVLRETSMPSVLIEVGFISNLEEERYLASEAGRDNLAQGIYRAFAIYKAQEDSKKSRNVETATATSPKESTKPSESPQQRDVAEGVPSVAVANDATQPVFKVQILSGSVKLTATDRQFKGLTPVETYQDGATYKYTYGANTDYNTISQLRKQIIDKFPSAFIIAFVGNEQMDVQEAIRIYKNNKK